MQKVKDVLYVIVTSIILLFLSYSSFLYTYVNLGHIQIKHILACLAFFFQIVPLELAQSNLYRLT